MAQERINNMSKIDFVTGRTAYVKDNLLITKESTSSYFKFAKLDITSEEADILRECSRYSFETVMGTEFKKFISAYCSIYDTYYDFSCQFVYDGEKYIMPQVYSYSNRFSARNASWQSYLENNGFKKIDTACFSFSGINSCSFVLKEGEEFEPNYERNLNNFFDANIGFGNANTKVYIYEGREFTFMDMFNEPLGPCYKVGDSVYKFGDGVKGFPLSKCEITGKYLDEYSIFKIVTDREYEVSKYTLFIGFDNVYGVKPEYVHDYTSKIRATRFVKCASTRYMYKVSDTIKFEFNYGTLYISIPAYNEGYRICCGCGSLFNVFDEYNTGDSEADIYEGRHFCPDCNPAINKLKINNYSYKPHPDFHGVGPMYFGVELEVGDSNGAKNLCRGLANINGIEKLMYAKHDGSLCEDGVELVTHPCSYNYHMHDFPWDEICKIINEHDGSNDCAGLHIHMSRGAMTDSIQRRIVYFINRYPNFFTAFARRSSYEVNDWCSFINTNITATSYTKALNILYENVDRFGRYTATNLQNTNTIEVRIFKADYNADYIRICVDILNGIYLMANSVDKDEDFCKMTIDDLIAFVNADTADEIDYFYDKANSDTVGISIIAPAESLKIGNKYFIKKSNVYMSSCGYYRSYDYNSIYFALRHIKEDPLKECILIHDFELNGVKYYVFHSSYRFANNERWTSEESYDNLAFLDALKREGIDIDIAEAAQSHNWDKSARIMILPADIITAKEVQ